LSRIVYPFGEGTNVQHISCHWFSGANADISEVSATARPMSALREALSQSGQGGEIGLQAQRPTAGATGALTRTCRRGVFPACGRRSRSGRAQVLQQCGPIT
jgi:hypothetical protein